MLWDWAATGQFFSSSGIIAGLKMCFRAILIILGFSVVSIELRNPLVKSLLLDHGFDNLYAALNLSFAAMPGIIERMPKPAELLRKRRTLIHEILNQSEILLSIFNKEPHRTPVFIISGDVHEGKTTFAKELIAELNSRGHSVSGFLAPGTFADGERNHFDLYDISTDEKIRLSDVNPDDGWIQFRKYGFNPLAIEKGNEILQRAENRDNIVIVDEVGPFEITGKGWSEGLLSLLRNDVISIWVVRKRLLKQVMAKWSGRTFYVFDIAEDKVKTAATEIEKLLPVKPRKFPNKGDNIP
jgi:nucleoside-triphosphatase THEP1